MPRKTYIFVITAGTFATVLSLGMNRETVYCCRLRWVEINLSYSVLVDERMYENKYLVDWYIIEWNGV
jgi:hypothetical protein